MSIIIAYLSKHMLYRSMLVYDSCICVYVSNVYVYVCINYSYKHHTVTIIIILRINSWYVQNNIYTLILNKFICHYHNLIRGHNSDLLVACDWFTYHILKGFLPPEFVAYYTRQRWCCSSYIIIIIIIIISGISSSVGGSRGSSSVAVFVCM